MGLKERRKKIMALMLAACVAGTSTVPVTASDISVFSDGTNAEPEVFDSSDVATAADTNTQKDVRVIYVDATDRQIDTDTIQVSSSATSVSVIKGEFAAPKGYELVTVGDIPIKDNGSLILKVKPAVKDVRVIYVDATDRQIDTDTIQVSSSATSVSVIKGEFAAPKGYELVTVGDIPIKDNGSLILKVKPAVKDVRVIYVDATDRQIDTDTIQVPSSATSVSVIKGEFAAPKGYELVTVGDIPIKDNGSLILKVKPAVKDVRVIYVDATDRQIDTDTIQVPSSATSVSVIKGEFAAPKGYELVTVGDIPIKDNGSLILKVKPAVKDVRVIYVDATDRQIDTDTIQVPSSATSVSVIKGEFAAPKGYELVTVGDIPIKDNGSLILKVKPAVKDVRVIYVDATDRQIDTDTIQVPSSATSVSVIKGEFAAPKGYELVTVGDILIKDNGSLILKVKPAVKDIKVIYVNAKTDKTVETSTLQVPSNATSVSVVKGKFAAPKGYELVTFGDFLIKNGGITLKVKASVKDVKVTYVDAESGDVVDNTTVKVPSDAAKVSVVKGKFDAPKGYELVTFGDFLIKNGGITLKVKASVKDVKVTYVDAESGDVVDNTTVKVPSDAAKVSVVKGKFDAPKGYELVTFGDFLIKNGGITLKVKASVKDVKVTYVDAENGKVVETSTVQVPCNATSVSVVKGKFYTPEGYELVTLGDLSIENNTLTVKVKAIPKKVGKTVKITYKLSKTKKVIATRKIVVDKKATSIKASSIPVPTGYKMVSSGNCSVRTRKITIYVTK